MAVTPVNVSGFSLAYQATSSAHLSHTAPSAQVFTHALPTAEETTSKLNRFILRALRDQSDQDGASLKTLLKWVMKEKNPTLQAALYKPTSYLGRLFSHESWDEWAESRTALGKVVHAFAAFLEGTKPLKTYMDRLDAQVIRGALQESHSVLAQIGKPRSGDCAVGLVAGAVGTLALQNPVPLTVAGLNCLDSVSAEREATFQGTVKLEPGQSVLLTGNRKIAVCKSGPTAWDGNARCDYAGPPLQVTITSGSDVRYTGPLSGSNQWFGDLSIFIENTSGQTSEMYVHAEDEWAEFGSWGFW